ncbi:MAG: hypothetical protein A3G59_02135 [Candidatus Taylorbacteria bacterium RIFCSPLOWO2_12_FULL_47_20]|uniref:FAD-binding FR-type domain-containing protein n=2 Tax=Candidatus Tayloriibacteriota TaxID=1817919 RepID=A0A1G2PC11_9BACT|nr:MAG: hypothetical protein A3H68_02985 [Candidatus Taylorbacteria bacterium RIFCSPLOWO2_02_FULL_46_40]OHA45249.1 MAG: hypothetical protein A3G59_02135 [Candidatus Taylorbacteria bacterium RIFCSPLOWO2_12_FULL_47_20]
MKSGTRKVWKLFLALNAAVILFFWWKTSGLILFENKASTLIAFGRLFGLFAAYSILFQFFLMGRNPLLEKIFGLDKLSRVHHTNGKVAVALILFHPIFLVAGYSLASGIGAWAQFIEFITQYPHVIWAFVGLLLFTFVVASSLYISFRRLKYETWYLVHLAVYLAAFASFWHQIANGTDLLSSRFFYVYWIALYAIVFVSHLFFRFVRPVHVSLKHKFVIAEIRRENYNTVSIYIGGRDLSSFRIKPGQFMIFRFLKRGFWWQAHPFSLSKMPDGQTLRITVKELGDFTRKISKLEVGTKIYIDGPYGIFTDFFGLNRPILFIAGGIGITPIRSLMEEMLRQGKNVVLLYGNKTAQDIIFRKELEELSAKYGSRIIHVLSEDKNFEGEIGRIDQEKISKLVPDFREREVYLCGPTAMMDSVQKGLAMLGVSKSKIHFEKFSLR